VREPGRWLSAYRKYLYLWLTSEALREDAIRLGQEITLDPAGSPCRKLGQASATSREFVAVRRLG
jgi:hypothetical protein